MMLKSDETLELQQKSLKKFVASYKGQLSVMGIFISLLFIEF